jgi:ABC-type phosphate transport system auxiliary subunit
MKQPESEIELVHLEMESRGLNMDHDLKEVFQPAVKILVEDLERRWNVCMDDLDDLKDRQANFARKQGELSGDDRNVLKGAMQTVFHLNELFCSMTAGAYQGMRLTTRDI